MNEHVEQMSYAEVVRSRDKAQIKADAYREVALNLACWMMAHDDFCSCTKCDWEDGEYCPKVVDYVNSCLEVSE